MNSLTLRAHVDLNQSMRTLLRQVKRDLAEAQGHQDIPFEYLVEALEVERDTSRHPLFQVMFSVQSFGHKMDFNLFKPVALECDDHIAKHDLSCFLDDSEAAIRGIIDFRTSLYKRSSIERMVSHYRLILAQLVDGLAQPLKDYRLLSASEYDQLVYQWNKTDKAYPQDKTIHGLFEAQVKQTPASIALVFKDKRLTYQQLNQQANQLGRYIRKQYREETKTPLRPDTLIALCLDRSLDMVIALLGILKAGGAYVPIDPSYPKERIGFMLADTQTRLVLTQSQLFEKVKGCMRDGSPTVCIAIDAKVHQQRLQAQSAANLEARSCSKDLVYVMYTSGTTGRPKGVLVEHQQVIHYRSWLLSQTKFTPQNIMDCSSSLVFDATVQMLWIGLTSGSQVVLCPEDIKKDAKQYLTYLNAYHIDVIKLTPSYLSSLLSVLSFEEKSSLSQLKHITVGGEQLAKVTLSELLSCRLSSELEVIHHYGPTETTVGALLSMIDRLNKGEDCPIVLGQPASNVNCYVLDRYCNPVPIGVIGELHIGGAGLARGYLNREELTREHFIPNPFVSEQNKVKGDTRLYKTGDLVRWLPDGNLEYIRRNDFQVKIRGYRIELGEIEQILSQIEGIAQCAVMARERKLNEREISHYLVAYYVLSDKDKMSHSTADDFITALSKQLPDYMVPPIYVELESLPLTVNGKLDRKALPDPEFVDEEGYVAPTTELEAQLCEIWQEVLSLDKVGVGDNFFRIGGNSILSIKLVHKINKVFNAKLSVADIFRKKTVAGLTEIMDSQFLLVKGYTKKTKPNLPYLIFIHPGSGGAEVYQELAEQLSGKFNCVGIDNYNIHCQPKIKSLTELAGHYLDELKSYFHNNLDKEQLYFCGWSLGGKIILEMLYRLEQSGQRHIKAVLLDTVISYDDNKQKQAPTSFPEELKNMLLKKYDAAYVKKAEETIESEWHIRQESVSGKIVTSKVMLLRAMQPSPIMNQEEHELFLERLKNNPWLGVDKVVEQVEKIDLDCDHYNIIENSLIIKTLLNFLQTI
ncbi:MAG: amino acid adenylation domain-containing protein [Pseudomonadota bacterium]